MLTQEKSALRPRWLSDPVGETYSAPAGLLAAAAQETILFAAGTSSPFDVLPLTPKQVEADNVPLNLEERPLDGSF